MLSFKKDYKKLYLIQDNFLDWWKTIGLPFYLTGGTALGRYYLNHRYSEDLDFFVNADNNYKNYIGKIKNEIGKHFNINIQESVFTDDYTRFFINEDNLFLKVEFVNDINIRTGKVVTAPFGLIDTPENILSNKLTAIISRDEPKDIFDIIHLAINYSFNWNDVFIEAKLKAVINEIDVEQRLYSFPSELFENVEWINSSVDVPNLKNTLKKITDDFLLGANNSVCSKELLLKDAKPEF